MSKLKTVDLLKLIEKRKGEFRISKYWVTPCIRHKRKMDGSGQEACPLISILPKNNGLRNDDLSYVAYMLKADIRSVEAIANAADGTKGALRKKLLAACGLEGTK